jgi:hexosaminidase
MDCCRHFFSVETIKKYIDLLAFYKMNVLHWHLTEDQGWRIEMEKYPKLNSIGSYRVDSNGLYGGFYSKNQIKEIVQYAAERYIEIIPEIELPGHSRAAIASYPYLSCEQKQIKVANSWGVFKDIYCAGNDSVFIFLENVFDEIVDLFPSNRIHIGGDEAPKFRWEHCEKCQKRMKNENLTNEHELQSYFIQRIAKILTKKNREIIGWDEILESEIRGEVSIQSWRGFSGGIEAIKQGKKAIMSPTSHCYFDYDIESIDLEKVYSFSPIPNGLDSAEQSLIIGGECNLWSERIPNETELDKKSFPRLLAMSEVLWRNPKKNYINFHKRVEDHYRILDILKVDYGIETIPAIINLEHGSNNHAIIDKKVNNLNYYYSWNGDSLKLLKSNRLVVDNSGTLNIQAFKNKKKYGKSIDQKISIHNGIGKSVSYENRYSKYYKSDGEKTLTNGKLGSLNFKDGNWQGYFGSNFEVTIDLDTITKLNSIGINFYQYINSWIVIPKNIQLYTSFDQKKWTKLRSIEDFSEIEKRGKFIKKALFNDLDNESRFIKITAENFKELPSWHEAAGSKCWIFTDEIIIK